MPRTDTDPSICEDFCDIIRVMGDILKLDESFIHTHIGTDISPRRRNASLIGLLAIKNAIHEYVQDGKKEDFSDILLNN